MRYLFIILLAILTPVVSAQSIDDVGKIMLGVDILETSTNETVELQSYLLNKLSKWVTEAGFSTYGFTFFSIVPNIIIDSEEMAEAGMKNVYVVSGSLMLSVIQNEGGIVFSTITFPFKESSTKRMTAVKNGIVNIQSSKIKPFLNEAKGKILQYYEYEKEKIFMHADFMAERKDYDGAIAYVMSIPSCLQSIYSESLAKASEYLDLRDKLYNDSLFVLANSYLAQHDAKSALDVLCGFRTTQDQQEVYQQLLEKAENLVTEEEQLKAAEKRQKYLDEKEQQYREWATQEEERKHRMEMETQQMAYDKEELAVYERLEKQRIESEERIANEKTASNERVETSRIFMIKNIAIEYFKNK